MLRVSWMPKDIPLVEKIKKASELVSLHPRQWDGPTVRHSFGSIMQRRTGKHHMEDIGFLDQEMAMDFIKECIFNLRWRDFQFMSSATQCGGNY